MSATTFTAPSQHGSAAARTCLPGKLKKQHPQASCVASKHRKASLFIAVNKRVAKTLNRCQEVPFGFTWTHGKTQKKP
jgi:hypothetical protein